jgi:hypothetical protein
MEGFSESGLIWALAFVTIGIVLVAGFVQWSRIKRKQERLGEDGHGGLRSDVRGPADPPHR